MKKILFVVYAVFLFALTTQIYAVKHHDLLGRLLNNQDFQGENVIVDVGMCQPDNDSDSSNIKDLKYIYFPTKNGAEISTWSQDNAEYVLLTTKFVQFDKDLQKTKITASLYMGEENSWLVYQTEKNGNESTQSFCCNTHEALTFE